LPIVSGSHARIHSHSGLYLSICPRTESRSSRFPSAMNRNCSSIKTIKSQHSIFKNLVDFLPEKSLLIFNDTKVIPARLHFQKDSGAEIEIFLLNPIAPEKLLATAMLAKNKCSWQCTIGNLKRWKDGQTLKKIGNTDLTASLTNRSEGTIEFTWPGDQTFSEIITGAGTTPLPPYIKRAAEKMIQPGIRLFTRPTKVQLQHPLPGFTLRKRFSNPYVTKELSRIFLRSM
jgi:hypothetical protein